MAPFLGGEVDFFVSESGAVLPLSAAPKRAADAPIPLVAFSSISCSSSMCFWMAVSPSVSDLSDTVFTVREWRFPRSSMQKAGLGTHGTGTCGTGTVLLGHALLGHAELGHFL